MRSMMQLSLKESKRVYIMERLVIGQLSVRQGAELLGLSERQIKRLKRRVSQRGVAALAHGNRGRSPVHAIPPAVQEMVVDLIKGLLKDASCQHVSELLAEMYDTSMSARSVRRIMAKAGLPNPHAHKAPRRRRSRDRVPQEGLLVQCDASQYRWLEDRAPTYWLHGAIDDATGKVLGLCLRPAEDLEGHFSVLRQMLEHYGVPRRIYSDKLAVFFSPKTDRLTLEEQLAGLQAPLTQYGRAIDELGIGHTPSHTPQSRGRIERLWQTLQHRLKIELRVSRISSLEQASAFLPAYMRKFNRRFAVAASCPDTAFSPAPEKLDLILCRKYQRKVSQGSTLSYGNHTYQLVTAKGTVALLRPRTVVHVLCHLDGALSAIYDGKHYRLREFKVPKPQLQRPAPRDRKPAPIPAADHPWRRPACRSLERDPIDLYFKANRKRHGGTAR